MHILALWAIAFSIFLVSISIDHLRDEAKATRDDLQFKTSIILSDENARLREEVAAWHKRNWIEKKSAPSKIKREVGS